MTWVRGHMIPGQGMASDDLMASVDLPATREMIWCLKQWGERDEADRLESWISESGGHDLPLLEIGAGNDAVRAAVAAHREGDLQKVESLLKAAAEERLPGGGLPGIAGDRRLCPLTTSAAAALWFQSGNWDDGEVAFQALLTHFSEGGGFGAAVPDKAANIQYAACVAAYLKALHFRLRSGFERTAYMFPESIPPEDGRFVLVESLTKGAVPRTVIDAGCGKGRFIRLLKQRHPQIEGVAVDISVSMLGMLPSDIKVQVGSLLDMGLPDEAGDFVFCIEALEHAVNARGAVRELARVTSSSGMLLIIDKCASSLGSMEICDWEQWFDADDVTNWLEEEGFRVEVQRGINKPGGLGLDKRFLCWIARRS